MVFGGIKRIYYSFILSIFLIAISFSQRVLVDRVIASVNGEPILESELRVASLYYGTADRRKLIDKLIERYLIYTYLKGTGAKVPEKYINETIERMAKMSGKEVDEFYEEIYRSGITPKDLKNFLEKEIMFSMGLQSLIASKLEKLNVEEELDDSKKRIVRKIKLLTVPRSKANLMAEAVKSRGNLEKMAEIVMEPVEELVVEKGDLVKPLDEKVWTSPVGIRVFAEDKDHIYIAEIVEEEELYGNKTRKEIEMELIRREFEKEKDKFLSKLRTNAIIEILY